MPKLPLVLLGITLLGVIASLARVHPESGGVVSLFRDLVAVGSVVGILAMVPTKFRRLGSGVYATTYLSVIGVFLMSLFAYRLVVFYLTLGTLIELTRATGI